MSFHIPGLDTPFLYKLLLSHLGGRRKKSSPQETYGFFLFLHFSCETRHPPDKHIQFDYTQHQQRLEQVQFAKYLGITISDDMDWGQHISEISAKATKTLMGFLLYNLHLGPLRKLHTKHWFALSSSMQHLFGIPIMKLRLDRWRRYRGQLPGGPAGDGETPVASATCLTNLSCHPWRPAGSSFP